MADGPENDFFATQFATAIAREMSAPDQSTYWFGRMTRFLGSDEYVFRNLFGADYTEKELLAKYQRGDFLVNRFDITNVVYTDDLANADMATVTMDVHIEAVIDGSNEIGDFTLSHKIKRGWQTYESTLIPV